MRLNIYRAVAAMTVGMALSVGAQNTNSGYFIDGNLYRHQLNPAFGNDANYISMPGVGNLSVGMHGTLQVDEVLFNVDGQTTTFLNPGVDAATFLQGIGNRNHIGADVNVPVMSAGFKAFGGYNTFTVGARAHVDAVIPRALFSLLKEGATNGEYDISDTRAQGNLFAEIALGHSRQFGKQWRVGVKLKFLLGGADVDMNLRQADLLLGEDNWTARTDAEIRSSVKGLSYKTDINNHTGHRYVSGADVDNTGINGFGLGIDLGAEYRPNADWRWSVAILDLGYIHWDNNVLATTNGLQQFETDKYTFNVNGDAPNSFEREWDRMRDQLSALYELEDKGDVGTRTTPLAATLNIGAEYTLPCWRKLSFGALSSTRIAGKFTATECRLSANIAPSKAFSAGVNFAAGTYGCSLGWMLNVHPKGFNFFIATDHTPHKLAKQGVPLSSNATVNMGINFPF